MLKNRSSSFKQIKAHPSINIGSGPHLKQLLLLMVLVVIGLSARLVFFSHWAGNPLFHVPTGDELNFHKTALSLIGEIDTDVDFLYQPLESFYLSLCYLLFGVSIPAVKTFQLLIGIANILIFYGLAGEFVHNQDLFKKRFVAFFSASFIALYGPQIFFEGQLLAPVLCVPLTASGLWCCLAATRKKSIWLQAIGGVLLGLAIMGRPNLAVITAPMIIWLLYRPWTWSQRAKTILVLLFALLVGVSPALVRNLLRGNGPVLVSASAGHSFYLGNNPQATGLFHVPKGKRIDPTDHDAYRRSWEILAEQSLGKKLTPSEVSSYWFNQGLSFWSEQPGQALKLTGTKLLLAINSYESPIHHPYILGKEVAPALGYLLSFGILFPFAVLGGWASFKKSSSSRLLVTCALVYLATLVVFYVADRYRILIVPMLTPLAGLGIFDLYHRARNSSWSKWLTPLLIITTSFLLTQIQVTPKTADLHSLAISYNIMGKVEGDRRNLAQAEKYFRKSIQFAGPHQGSTARFNLAIILERRGDMNEAKKLYTEAARIDPDTRFARVRLAMMSERTGHYQEALRWWKEVESISADPDEARRQIKRIQILIQKDTQKTLQ